MSEFSDREFAITPMTGIRSFRVDGLGRLGPPAQGSKPFKPGWNDAECAATLYAPVHRALIALSSSLQPEKAKGGFVAVPDEPHQVASLRCSCGFYAYHDNGHNPHHRESENVLAIVEGAGLVTVGSRGFRASKLRLVALIDPGTAKSQSRIDRLSAWLAEHEVTTLLGSSVGLTAGISGLIAGLKYGWWPVSALGGLVAALAAVAFILGLRGIPINVDRKYAGPRPSLALVRAAYPDVPVYPTVAAALKAHPLTPPPPPDPSDDDFWTRAA